MSAGEAQDYQRRRPSMGYEHAWIRGICRATESVSSQVSRGACFPPSNTFAVKLACDELRTLELYEFSSFFFSIAQTEGEKATNAKQGDVGAKKNDSAGKLASQVRIEKTLAILLEAHSICRREDQSDHRSHHSHHSR